MVFPWQRRSSSEGVAESGVSTPPGRRSSASPSRQRRTPSPQKRRPSEEFGAGASAGGEPSAAFAAAAGKATTVDEKTLRALLLKQPTAQELAMTDDLLSAFLHESCSLLSDKLERGSPSSVLARASPRRFSCTHYLRAIDDLRAYRESVGAQVCLLYTSPSPRDRQKSRMPSSA